MQIRIAGIVEDSIVDGRGIRMAVFVQGCPHHCPGCHNPQTHDFAGGTLDDTDRIFEAFRENPLYRGITFSGGEPFCQPKPLKALADRVHGIKKDVTVYTGWTYEALCAMHDPDVDALLSVCDVLVDGPFIEAQRDPELLFRGSANQRLIDMNRTRERGEVTLLELNW
ncbi:anaerobic ribonucleoside-triphosphate reductase activating protein [Anaeromassilibacillus senegalensis]|uniref:Anaerobic ribonucleoside-triphosphate reductase-activating protein n=1 Tax=Anaeromassilibacillus senegalensis TaxID=1673717 RepID=A0ABS9CMZ0_9FIRM|nr:anaerobic ribonucleoside-triphosphate reductase activating protein [Anaeromassilibacillus senegalensis]MCF2652522.1 anaerobic ribonucleoside-triphosphate reductase activating protein [Anaeromassilibacillus senegalensis]